MNNTFDIKRFRNFFAHTVRSEYKRLLLSTFSLFAAWMAVLVLPALYSYDYYANHHTGTQDPMWYSITGLLTFFIFLYPAVTASMTFGNLGKKEDRISALMVPASILEKFITRWIIYVPLALIAFVITFECADLIRCAIGAIRFGDHNCFHPYLSSANTELFTDSFYQEQIYSFAFLIQGLYLLGSIIWPKNSLIITTGVLFGIGVALVSYTGWLGSMMFDAGMHYSWNATVSVDASTVLLWSNIIMATIFWVIAYFRFKEIEIIQRW